MSATSIGLIGMATLVGMIMARIPVAVALGLVGFVGYAAIDGFAKARLVFGAVPLGSPPPIRSRYCRCSR